MWNRYWVLCFTPFYCVLRDTRSATESGGFVVWDGQTWGMMTIGVWWKLPCGGRATLVFHSSGMQGKRNIDAWELSCVHHHLRMTRRNANLKFSLSNSTSKSCKFDQRLFPGSHLLLCHPATQGPAHCVSISSTVQIVQSVADYMTYAMTWDNSQPSHKEKSWSISKATSFYGISSLYLLSISSSSIFLTKLLSHMNTTSLFLLFSFLVSRCIYYIMPYAMWKLIPHSSALFLLTQVLFSPYLLSSFSPFLDILLTLFFFNRFIIFFLFHFLLIHILTSERMSLNQIISEGVLGVKIQ